MTIISPDDLKKILASHADWLADVVCGSRANFRNANLIGANLSDVPVVPNIDATILAAIETDENALDMDTWHECATTHCRAGWAIHLAGKRGYALEKRVGPAVAGVLIYAASRPDKPVPDFYASDESALQSICDDAGAVSA